MVIQTKTISEEKIKLRWNEPYVSEASDIQASVNSPGVYRGGFLKSISPSPNQFFRVTKDSDVDTALLHFNSSSGIATVMRLDSDELIDMSSEFPILADTVWYVYASVSYVSGSPTTASIEVSDVMPSGDEIMLGAIFMPAGALTILDSYVRTDGVYRKLPSSRRGLIIPKSVRVPALAGRTEFQISDRVYLYNGGYVTDMANARVKLYDDLTDSFKPLVGSDGGQIRVSRVTSVTGGVVPIPFSSLDSDGCFSNPFVIMDFSDTVDTVYAGQFYANYWAYCELDEIPTGFAAEGNIFHGVHVQDVLTKTLTNSGTALPVSTVSSGFLGTVLETLFQFIRHKVDINQQPAVSPGWLPLWRSHGNSNVYEQIDIYWKDSSLAVVMNGSMDTAGNVSWRTAGHLNVWILGLSSNKFMYRYEATPPSPISVNTSSDWQVYQDRNVTTGGDAQTFYDVPVVRIFEKYVRAVVQQTAGSSSGDHLMVAYFEAINLRVYFTGLSTATGAIVFAHNCSWVSGTEWTADSSSSKATKVSISGPNGLLVSCKNNPASNWTSWDTEYRLGSRNSSAAAYLNCIESISGDSYEVCRVSGLKNSSYVTSSGVPTKTNQAYCPVNWRSKRNVAPTTFSYDPSSGTYFDSIVVVSGADEWGGSVVVTRVATVDDTWSDVTDAVNGTGDSWFVLDGNHSRSIANGNLIEISGSTSNDGLYIVESCEYDGSDTIVHVKGAITAESYGTNATLSVYGSNAIYFDVNVGVKN